MKNFTKVCLAGLTVLGLGSLFLVSNEMFADSDPTPANSTAIVDLTVVPGEVTIGIEDPSITVSGAVQSSFLVQVVEKTFSGSFWLQDLKGSASGYYTTVQVTDLVNQGTGMESYKIGSGNVEFKAHDATPDLVTGAANAQVLITDENYHPLNNVWTYIYRNQNTNPGVLGKYDDIPTIKVTVPANTPAGNYRGTLTYTLFEPGASS